MRRKSLTSYLVNFSIACRPMAYRFSALLPLWLNQGRPRFNLLSGKNKIFWICTSSNYMSQSQAWNQQSVARSDQQANAAPRRPRPSHLRTETWDEEKDREEGRKNEGMREGQ